MATKYGGWVSGDDYRVVMDYSVSNNSNGTTCTVSVTTKIQVTYYLSNYDVSWSATANGTSSGTKNISVSGGTATLGSRSVTVNRGTTAGSLAVSAACNAYGSSSTSATVSIPALASYAITYNANGGSGAPATQTKYHGTAITLQKGIPTRANYEFLGWSTNPSATAADSAYTKAKMTAGVSYTTNAALTLYAVWKLAFVAPTISSFTAYRSDASGNSDPSSTEYMTFKCVWSFNQTGGTNNSGSVKFTYGSTSTTVTISGATSGTATKTVSGTFTDAYAVTALLTDKNGLTATKSTRVATIWRPFTMRKTGTNAASAAFFGLADTVAENLLKIFGRLDIEGQVSSYVEGAQGKAGLRFYKRELGVNQWNPAILLQTKAGGNWTIGNYSGEELRVVYFTKANIDAGTNTAGLNLAFGTDVYSWHQAISTWKSIASTTGTTKKTFTLPTNCSEILVVCTHTPSGSSARDYASSVVIPRAQLTTAETEWYLGGGVTTTNVTSGRQACCTLTSTYITPVSVRVDGSTVSASWTVYAR